MVQLVSGCVPTSGPKAGQSCVFPFTFNGKTCPGPSCCNLDNDSKGNWCSTKVDGNGVHITGNYGYCKGTQCQPQGIILFYFIRFESKSMLDNHLCFLCNILKQAPLYEIILILRLVEALVYNILRQQL